VSIRSVPNSNDLMSQSLTTDRMRVCVCVQLCGGRVTLVCGMHWLAHVPPSHELRGSL
jgi:hypothetical protein